MASAKKPLANRFAATCAGCWQRVEAEAGRYEVLGTGLGRWTRVRCLPCIKAGRQDGPEALPGKVHNDLGELLSDDPMEFVVLHDDQWKIALTYAQVAAVIAMAKGLYRA